MDRKTLPPVVAVSCLSLGLTACAPSPPRPHSLLERCKSVMHEAWGDSSLEDVRGNAMLNNTTLQIPATVVKPDGARRQIYLKCTFDHNVLVGIQWEDQPTRP